MNTQNIATKMIFLTFHDIDRNLDKWAWSQFNFSLFQRHSSALDLLHSVIVNPKVAWHMSVVKVDVREAVWIVEAPMTQRGGLPFGSILNGLSLMTSIGGIMSRIARAMTDLPFEIQMK